MRQVEVKLKEMGFNVSSEWVQACVEFCKSQTPNVSVDRLVKDVSEQWVNADITVEGTQAGPQIQNLSKDVVKGPVLQGRFVLQVQRAIDIGQNSAFAQLQNIMKTANENTLVSADNDTQRPYTANWEPKSKRMLEFTLTDGFNSFSALEFEPLAQISYPVPPGLKIELRGPITVRRGMLLLQSRNLVKVVGGHVIELENKCSLVQVLAEVLGQNGHILQGQVPARQVSSVHQNNSAPGPSRIQPANQYNTHGQNTNMPDELFDDLDDNLFNEIDVSGAVQEPRRQSNQNRARNSASNVQMTKSLGRPAEPSSSKGSSAKKIRKSPISMSAWNDTGDDAWLCDEENWAESHVPGAQDPEFPDDDDIFEAAEHLEPNKIDNSKMSISSRLAKAKQDMKSQRLTIPDRPGPSSRDLTQKGLKAEVKIETVSQSEGSGSSTNVADLMRANVKREPNSHVKESKKELFQSPPEVYQGKSPNDKKVKDNSFLDAARGKPYTYLSLIPKNASCVEVLKGSIVTLVGKMAVADGSSGKVWLVKVAFTDGSSTITASLAPKIVEDVFGFSPVAYGRLPSDQKSSTLKTASAKMSSLLSTFNGLVRMRFDAAPKDPEILELIQFNRGHLQQLKLRINKYNQS